MPNSSFHTAISQPRYSRYLSACGNKRRALKLYRANITVSLKMYAIIGIFEVILRNSIDRHMIACKGPLWLEEAIAEGGYLNVSQGCEESLRLVQKAIRKLSFRYSHDDLVAKLNFGFWRYQFGLKEYIASGNTLLEIFKNRPLGVNQKVIFQCLTKINEMRNRIAHHEPICFKGDLISTSTIQSRYNTIIELLQWLGCNSPKILYGIDGVQKSLADIDILTRHSIKV
jgi:hypothetical protein